MPPTRPVPARPAPARLALLTLLALPLPAGADPALECSRASQVETAACLGAVEGTVDRTVAEALAIARARMAELDSATGRAQGLPALDAAQAAWAAWRDAECEAVGATWGGGSGTGIAIMACRITLGRARTEALLRLGG